MLAATEGCVLWLVVLGVVVAFYLAQQRARLVVRITDGRASVVRGRLPPGLFDDLQAVAHLSPDATGRVEVSGQGPSLRVRTRGLPEGPAQRVRNVVYLRRRDV
jgi:hypothetical protein